MLLENFTPHSAYIVCESTPKMELIIVGFFLGVVTTLFMVEVYRVLWKEELKQ